MKKVLACLLALALILTLFAACGKTDDATTAAPAENGSSESGSAENGATENGTTESGATENGAEPADSPFKTFGDAIAVEGKEAEIYAAYEDVCIYAFRANGSYWRLTAGLTGEQAAALTELDPVEETYNEEMAKLTAPLAVTKCENLDALILSDEALAALAGKTGADLIADGWTAGTGYSLNEPEFLLEYGPFTYSVIFEPAEISESEEGFDILAAVRPLTVKSVSFVGFGEGATARSAVE